MFPLQYCSEYCHPRCRFHHWSYLRLETRSRRYCLHSSFGLCWLHPSRTYFFSPFGFCRFSYSQFVMQRVVVLKDEQNKRAHESSAQLACEAAGSIRTVASLTREDDCCRIYSESLEAPLRRSNRTAFWSNLIFALSQSMTFYVIALVFWYGSRLVSSFEVSTFHFFIALMVSAFS